MQRSKWERHTSLEEISQSGRTWDSFNSVGSASAHSDFASKEHGKSPGMLWGRTGLVQDNKKTAQGPEAGAVSTLEQDAKWWQKNLLDPKTGKTTDQKVLYDVKGEDRGVCLSALLGHPCSRGKDCTFLHPVQPITNTHVGKDLCYGMFRLSLRYNLGIGDTAVVQILEVVTPTCISVWILDENCTVERLHQKAISYLPMDEKILLHPPGLSDLIDEVTRFYSSNLHLDLSYRSLRDIPDTFIAVKQLYHGQPQWFRGVVIRFCETSDNGRPAVQVRLTDMGKSVYVHQVQLLRRLDRQFLHQPWFAFSLGLGGLYFPIDITSCDSSMDWFRRRLSGTVAFVEVLERDEIDDRPMVKISLPSEQDETATLAFNDEVAAKGFAIRRAAEIAVETYDYEEAVSDEENYFEEPRVIPG